MPINFTVVPVEDGEDGGSAAAAAAAAAGGGKRASLCKLFQGEEDDDSLQGPSSGRNVVPAALLCPPVRGPF